MKGVVDLFIAKDKIAVFWFLVTCGVIVGAAWYLDKSIKEVHSKPQFVIMDSAGVYYLAPTVDFENAVELHAAQTRLARRSDFPESEDSSKSGGGKNRSAEDGWRRGLDLGYGADHSSRCLQGEDLQRSV